MFFKNFFDKRIKNEFLSINIQSLLMGLIIGLVILLVVFMLKSDSWISQTTIIITFLFSVVITGTISNSLHLVKRLTKYEFKKKWTVPVIFYAAICIGMFVGTELTYFILSWFFSFDYSFGSYVNEYKFNWIISVIVGTIVYINEFQKKNYEFSLKDKEVQLSKVNQLKIQAELEVLHSRINPHFLYNALNSIASLIHEAPDKAEDMTIKLSKLFRYSINSSNDVFIKVKEEMEIVKIYLDIERVRFGEKLDVEMNVDSEIYENYLPRFLIQPLIENSLKHGVNKISGKGSLKIYLSSDKHHIFISVHDNGPVFPDDISIGYGMQSTYEKLNLLFPDQYELKMLNGSYKEIYIRIPRKYEI